MRNIPHNNSWRICRRFSILPLASCESILKSTSMLADVHIVLALQRQIATHTHSHTGMVNIDTHTHECLEASKIEKKGILCRESADFQDPLIQLEECIKSNLEWKVRFNMTSVWMLTKSPPVECKRVCLPRHPGHAKTPRTSSHCDVHFAHLQDSSLRQQPRRRHLVRWHLASHWVHLKKLLFAFGWLSCLAPAQRQLLFWPKRIYWLWRSQ